MMEGRRAANLDEGKVMSFVKQINNFPKKQTSPEKNLFRKFLYYWHIRLCLQSEKEKENNKW